MQQRLSFITLGVLDLQKSRNFYSNVFGWKPIQDDDSIVFFQLNGMILSLYRSDDLAKDATVNSEGNGFKKFTLAYLCMSINEVDNIYNDIIAKGGNAIKAPEKVFWGGYSGYISDCDDNLWEIAFNPFIKLDVDGKILSINQE